jgi:nitric oxide reductase subunit B
VSPDWQKSLKTMVVGYKIFHLSLLIFFFALILAGVQKSIWMYFTKNVAFSEMQNSLYWIYLVFLIFGVGILVGLSLIILPAIKHFVAVIREPKK